MPGAYLYGWCDDPAGWVKCLVTEQGKLIIDPTEIFEDDPTDNEHGKAPTSNWAHDHEELTTAHHAKYTDAEAVASFGNRAVTLTAGTYSDYDLLNVNVIYFDGSAGDISLQGFAGGTDGKVVFLVKSIAQGYVNVYHQHAGAAVGDKIRTSNLQNMIFDSGYFGVAILVYKDDHWHFNNFIYNYWNRLFDNTPLDGVWIRGITSNWAFDHNADMTKHVTGGNSHDHDGGDGGQIDHTKLDNIGTNLHAGIDSHISETSDPHGSALSQSILNILLGIRTGAGTIQDTGTHTIISSMNAADVYLITACGKHSDHEYTSFGYGVWFAFTVYNSYDSAYEVKILPLFTTAYTNKIIVAALNMNVAIAYSQVGRGTSSLYWNTLKFR